MEDERFDRIDIADNSEPCVVFVMSLSIVKPFNFLARRFVKKSIAAILKEIEDQRPVGYLAHEHFNGNPSLLIFYWKDLDQLLAYARDKSASHFPAWFSFNEEISHSKAVGFWHEIYELPPSSYKGVYRNCPLTGMARFLPVTKLTTFKKR